MQNCNNFNQGVADWQRKLGTQWATTPALKSFSFNWNLTLKVNLLSKVYILCWPCTHLLLIMLEHFQQPRFILKQ